MYAIIIEKLTKKFKQKKKQYKNAVDNLSLKIQNGEVFGLLGPNGAGKSTTIKMITGLTRPDSGRVFIQGIQSPRLAARQQLGYLPEHPTFYDYLSALEYLQFTGGIFHIDKITLKKRSKQILQRLGLWEVRNKPLRLYSKGMVQRLGIAHVLIHNPDVYILDEPMSGLDPLGRALVKEIILELKEAGKCVFLSSHIIADVEQICDRIGIISNGKLLTVQKVADVMQKGITGYTIHFTKPDGSMYVQHIKKNMISDFVLKHQDSSEKITLIEPRRKALEEYFLEMVTPKSI